MPWKLSNLMTQGRHGPQTKNECAEEGQQKITRPDHRNYFDDEVAKQYGGLARSFARISRSALSIIRNLHTDVISQPRQNRNVSHETVGTASRDTVSLPFVIPCLILAISY
jgi:hypothetical protein